MLGENTGMSKYTAKSGATALGANIIAAVEALGAYTAAGYGILAENGNYRHQAR